MRARRGQHRHGADLRHHAQRVDRLREVGPIGLQADALVEVAAKVAAMRVHGRAGEACPVCGDTVRDFAFASTTAQYCPTCQTGGVLL